MGDFDDLLDDLDSGNETVDEELDFLEEEEEAPPISKKKKRGKKKASRKAAPPPPDDEEEEEAPPPKPTRKKKTSKKKASRKAATPPPEVETDDEEEAATPKPTRKKKVAKKKASKKRAPRIDGTDPVVALTTKLAGITESVNEKRDIAVIKADIRAAKQLSTKLHKFAEEAAKAADAQDSRVLSLEAQLEKLTSGGSDEEDDE